MKYYALCGPQDWMAEVGWLSHALNTWSLMDILLEAYKAILL